MPFFRHDPERDDPYQFNLDLGTPSPEVTPIRDQYSGLTEAIAAAEKETLWQERPHGSVMVIIEANGSGFVVDDSGELAYTFLGWAPHVRGKMSGCLVVASGHSPQDQEALQETLRQTVGKLRPESPVIIVEQETKDTNTVWRAEVLRTLDLVQGDILTRKYRGYVVWRARTAAEREAVNLLSLWSQSEEPWKRNLIPDCLAEMKRNYASQGYRVLDSDQIMFLLSHTRLPAGAFGSLTLGFGVVIQSYRCDCTWRVDVNGNNTLVYSCSDPLCEEKEKPTGPLMAFTQALDFDSGAPRCYDTTSIVVLPDTCYECGHNFVEKAVILGTTRREYKLRVEIHCVGSGCVDNGLIEYRDMVVPKDRVIS